MSEPKLIQVHPGIYTRGHTKRYDAEKMLSALWNKDVRLIVNVSPSLDPALRAAAATVGMTYLHKPLADGKLVPGVAVNDLVVLAYRADPTIRLIGTVSASDGSDDYTVAVAAAGVYGSGGPYASWLMIHAAFLTSEDEVAEIAVALAVAI